MVVWKGDNDWECRRLLERRGIVSSEGRRRIQSVEDESSKGQFDGWMDDVGRFRWNESPIYGDNDARRCRWGESVGDVGRRTDGEDESSKGRCDDLMDVGGRFRWDESPTAGDDDARRGSW